MSNIEAKVAQIFICSEKGAPMTEVDFVTAVIGVGLLGSGGTLDRYAVRSESGKSRGAWSGVRTEDENRQVTIIAAEAIALANASGGVQWEAKDTRRQIVLDGISAAELNKLVERGQEPNTWRNGKTIQVGEAVLQITEHCDPCSRPSNLLRQRRVDKGDFAERFAANGGLRAKIIAGGEIINGAEFKVIEKSAQ